MGAQLFGKYEFIILDEIQNIVGWELYVTRLRRNGKKIIITGSNSNLLSGELITHLTGRYLSITILPFSFNEILELMHTSIFGQLNSKDRNKILYTTEGRANILNALEQYIEIGGFPESYSRGSMMIQNIYDGIINKDIISRYSIRNIKAFRSLTGYIISNYSNFFSYAKLGNNLGIKDVNTVKRYITYLEESFLIFILDKFSPKLKTQIQSAKKIYIIDVGFISKIGFSIGKTRGRLIENIVAIELLRRSNMQDTQLFERFYYWKDYNGYEIDFVLFGQNSIKQLIQVSYIQTRAEIPPRELKNFFKAEKELRCDNFLLITWTFEDIIEMDGKKINCVPLWKWLIS